MQRHSRLAALFLLYLMVFVSPSMANSLDVEKKNQVGTRHVQAKQAFIQAVEAFRRGDYSQAIFGFNVAAGLGLKSSALQQNLGASYYKEGLYVQAENAFLALTHYNKMTALAYYNLGLVSLKKGKISQANSWFFKANKKTKDEKLKRLSAYQLSQLGLFDGSSDRPRHSEDWFTLLSVAVGYDDNVALANGGVSSNTQRTSAIVGKVLLYSRGVLWGKKGNGLIFKGNVYRKLSGSPRKASIMNYMAGLSYQAPFNLWNHEVAALFDRTRLGGTHFLDKLTFVLSSNKQIAERFRLDMRMRYRRINAPKLYRQLEGNHEDVRVKGRWKIARKRQFDLTYRLDLNDRKDLIAGTKFSSRSPVRQRLKGVYKVPLAFRYILKLGSEYRISQYKKANVDAAGLVLKRKDNRYKVRIGLAYEYRSDTSLNITYAYANNRSNINQFDYSQNTLMGKVQYTF